MDETTEIEGTQEIELAGRVFQPCVVTTFAQDFFVTERVRKARLEDAGREVTTEGELREMAQDIILKAYREGVLFELLAGVLVEKGEAWDEVSAYLNADFFSTLTDPKDKLALNEALVGVILGFFLEEGGSLKISRNSSTKKKKGGKKKRAIGEPLTSETGTP